MDFFMKSEQYHGFELPEYFTFDEVLKYVREKVGNTPYEECLQGSVSPDSLSDVNLDILLNKDGRYAVRPIILANPFLYYFLVREICCENNWQVIKDLFEKFNVTTKNGDLDKSIIENLTLKKVVINGDKLK